MSKFLERIIGNEEKEGYLAPMYNARVIVHYPWFANTYLLPYFYSKLFTGTDDYSNLLKDSNWGNAICKEIIDEINNKIDKETENDTIHLFYSRDILGRDIQRVIKDDFTSFTVTKEEEGKNVEITLIDKNNNSYYVKRINFCRYFPRFLFLDFSVDIFQRLYTSDKISKYNIIANFLTEHFLNIIPIFNIEEKIVSDFITDNQINKIQIFSDTPDEAQRLSRIINTSLKHIPHITTTVIDNESLSKLNACDSKNTFNIYFYSAPYNILFLKKKYQYLPFQLQSLSFQNFDTACYLISRKEHFDPDNKLKNGLTEFFRYIFWKAKETPEHFYKITQSFNFISAIKQPSVLFENEYCFAKCLSLFVNPNDIEKDFRKTDDNNPISKRLIFESLFNNSHNEGYEKEKNKLLYGVKQVYTLITLNYLIDNIEKIHLFRTKSFSSVCEALQNTVFNTGFYNKVFEQFIKYQVAQFVNKYKKANNITNPICEAITKYDIKEYKICQRLIFEIKYHFNQVLIKECQAEDVFLTTDQHTFVLKKMLQQTPNDYEQKAVFKHLQEIFANTVVKCATFYEDIVGLDHFGLQSIFRNSTVKNLLLSNITMTSSIYTKREIEVEENFSTIKSISRYGKG
jgi:hypothetical protein